MTTDIAFDRHAFTSFDIGLRSIELTIIPLDLILPERLEVIAANGAGIETIDCIARRGNLRVLWTLIDAAVDRIEMDEESFRLVFQGGTIIRRRYARDADAVIVQDNYSRELMRYPDCLTASGEKGIAAVNEVLKESRRDYGNPKQQSGPWEIRSLHVPKSFRP